MHRINAEKLRTLLHGVRRMLRADLWFPHIPLAALMWLGGVWLLQADVGRNWQHYFTRIIDGSVIMPPRMLPPILIGSGMLTMALGLLWRSRIAWVMAMLLVLTAAISTRALSATRAPAL